MSYTFQDFFSPLEEIRKTEPNYGIPTVVPDTSIADAKRFDLDSFLKKTPVSILEEGSKCVYQQTVHWQTKEYEIPNNPKQFEMVCMLAGVSVSGKGPSKKVAKHKAAIQYLHEVVKKGRHKDFRIPGETEEEAHKAIDTLAERSDKPSLLTPTKESSSQNEFAGAEESEIPTANSIPAEHANNANWVGKLQEFLHKNKIGSPIYEEEACTSGFSVICRVRELKTRGIFSTKKIAKTISACLMFQTVEKDLEKLLQADFANDMDFEEDNTPESRRMIEIAEKAFKEKDAEGALKAILSDTHRFTNFDMKYQLPSQSTIGMKQIFLEITITIVPPPDVDDLEVGAEHTQTEEIARVSAAKDRERKKAMEGGPFVFGGMGADETDAKQNACQSALIHFNTYGFETN